MGKENPVREGARQRQNLIENINRIGEGRIAVSPSVAATITIFPQSLLKRVGITITPDNKGNIIIQATKAERGKNLLKPIIEWLSKDPASQERFLADLYTTLYGIIQQSSNLGKVDLSSYEKKLLTVAGELEESFLFSVAEFIKEGGILTDLDQKELHGTLTRIFHLLEERNSVFVREWRRKGITPENVFSSLD